MTTFDEREKGFEKKFAFDEELKFKATARRNRLLGNWAAQLLDLAGDAATGYAKQVVAAGMEAGTADPVLRKVASDLASKGVTENDVAEKMRELLAVALQHIEAES